MINKTVADTSLRLLFPTSKSFSKGTKRSSCTGLECYGINNTNKIT